MQASAFVGIIALPVVLFVGLLIMRIATVALTFTGMSRDLARFQARSAFTGCGFTTRESERIAEHPVRRRLIMFLMLMGNGTVIMAITSLMPIFLSIRADEDPHQPYYILLWLCSGLALLWAFANSKWIDRRLSRFIGWALRNFTSLDVRDFHGLLHLSEGFTVIDLNITENHWVTGRNLIELRLPEEGIQVLGIQRSDGAFIGTPTGQTYIRAGDTVMLYGRNEQLGELEKRPKGEIGDNAHEQNCQRQYARLQEQQRRDIRGPRSNDGNTKKSD